ncbi:PAB-dependent poly [Spathaspora sp. JA1]|nr:PAB-dependent poly [Spathaspora sp. JA1]
MNINLDNAKDTLCKNITIYGYCKFENKGCAFSHRRPTLPPSQSQPQITPLVQQLNITSSFEIPSSAGSTHSSHSSDSKRKYDFNTPSFQPSNLNNSNSSTKFASPKVEQIPVFVPDGGGSSSGYKFNASTPSFTPAPASQASGASPAATAPIPTGMPSTQPVVPPPQSSTPNPYLNDPYYQHPAAAAAATKYPLQYHLYAPQPPPRLTLPLTPHESNPHLLFLPNDLRETLHRKNEASLQTMIHSSLPVSVNQYHSLVPIDRNYQDGNSILYKVFSSFDGNVYAMRKIDGIESDSINFTKFKKWKSLNCANVVNVVDSFSSLSFGGSCLIVVFDYFPNSMTLYEQYKKVGGIVTEEMLWNYMLQLVNAVASLHEKGLTGNGTINLNKIIITNSDRIRLSNGSISDLLGDEPGSRAEDIVSVGRVLSELSQGMRNRISEELSMTIQELTNTGDQFDLAGFQGKISKQLFSNFDKLQNSNDFLEAQLTSELENARLFRLMTKINYILSNNLPNEQVKTIKLFHNFIFNCFDEMGKRIIDLSKVIINLNKLDCGIDEKVLLVSNDDNECIIASFKEIRDIIDSQFRIIRE